MAKISSGITPVCVLVVDDHPSSASMLARVIAQLGPSVEVIAAEGGDQALEIMRGKCVDVLVTDLVMPGVTGLELIERMQRLPCNRPAYTILMTAYDVPGLKEIARRLMVNEVVRKPIPPESLCRIVADAIEICGYGPIVRTDAGSGQTGKAAPGGDPGPESLIP